jgi:hypothetical protein
MSEATAHTRDVVVPDTCTVPLTYRGPLVHRGIGISRETYGKAWALRLADGVWTLADHNGDEVYSFSQDGLHGKVAFPGSPPGNKCLCLVGLGARIHCFEPDPAALDALRPYVGLSERANAPQLARWHRAVGFGFLGLGVLLLAGCAAAGTAVLLSHDLTGFLRLNVGLVILLPGLGVGGYFVSAGLGYLREAHAYATMAEAVRRPNP